MFETGTNQWSTFLQWPPVTGKGDLYFGAGTLSSGKPKPGSADDGKDVFVSDPRHPVPASAFPAEDLDHDYMTADQRFASRRPDVVTYDSGALAEDVAVAGPIVADVYVATDRADLDVVVKVIDVWPEDTEDPKPNPKSVRAGGYQQLVRAEVMRGRFRNDFAKPERFISNSPTLVKVTLPDVLHTFRSGHRIMVQVQSSWFPLIDRNPQAWVDNIADADDEAFVAATHTIFHDVAHPSALHVGVLRGRLP